MLFIFLSPRFCEILAHNYAPGAQLLQKQLLQKHMLLEHDLSQWSNIINQTCFRSMFWMQLLQEHICYIRIVYSNIILPGIFDLKYYPLDYNSCYRSIIECTMSIYIDIVYSVSAPGAWLIIVWSIIRSQICYREDIFECNAKCDIHATIMLLEQLHSKHPPGACWT